MPPWCIRETLHSCWRTGRKKRIPKQSFAASAFASTVQLVAIAYHGVLFVCSVYALFVLVSAVFGNWIVIPRYFECYITREQQYTTPVAHMMRFSLCGCESQEYVGASGLSNAPLTLYGYDIT